MRMKKDHKKGEDKNDKKKSNSYMYKSSPYANDVIPYIFEMTQYMYRMEKEVEEE